MTEFEIQILSTGLRPLVALIGELDINSAPKVREALLTLQGQGATGFVLDVTKLSFIDSTGLGTLVAVWNALGSPERAIRLAGATPAVARAFAITGLADIFPNFSSAEEAAVQ